MSMSISYYHIDSFASELFAGNPAGVCLLPAFPVNDVMQKSQRRTVTAKPLL